MTERHNLLVIFFFSIFIVTLRMTKDVKVHRLGMARNVKVRLRRSEETKYAFLWPALYNPYAPVHCMSPYTTDPRKTHQIEMSRRLNRKKKYHVK